MALPDMRAHQSAAQLPAPTRLRICDLPAAVTAAKSDWASVLDIDVDDRTLGFTPRTDDTQGRGAIRSTIHSQLRGGLVLEYVTHEMPQPNAGSRPHTDEEREVHAATAGRLVAVHRIDSNQPVHGRAAMGSARYDQMQKRWARPDQPWRWAVRFVIVQSWRIVDRPLARDVLGDALYAHIFQHPAGALRPLDDDARAAIADLMVEEVATVATPAVEGKLIEMARIDNMERFRKADAITAEDGLIIADLREACEGMKRERMREIAWRDRRIIAQKKRSVPAICEACGYKPPGDAGFQCLDVHHLHPISAGVRMTTLADLAVLCPTCHREVHAGVRDLGGRAVAA